MAKIEFKGKVKNVYNIDETIAYQYVAVPTFDRKHCDMHAFRQHHKFGAYANSDLFRGMLNRIRSDKFGDSGMLILSKVPEGITVDTSGFLAVVSFDV